jgi:hypothetical protein
VTTTSTVGLRTGKLPKGTPFELDCQDPLILEVPTDASGFVANASSSRGAGTHLPILSNLRAPAISAGPRPQQLIVERGAQFVNIGWSSTLADGVYDVTTSFKTSCVHPTQQKIIVAANVSCGGSTSRLEKSCRRLVTEDLASDQSNCHANVR